jgi:hypothetical protein
MKWIVATLCAVSLNVMADTWVMPNNGGGQVVLTDRLCQGYKTLYYAYTYTPQMFLDGCWRLMDGKVHVVWEKSGRRVYQMNDFVADEVTPKKKGQQL